MINNDKLFQMSVEIEELQQIYTDLIVSIKNSSQPPNLKIEFYPYVGINNRIRLRDDLIYVKISDLLCEAPLELHRALAEILLRKLYRKKVPASVSQIFQDFIKKADMREKSIESRKSRGRKILIGSQGAHYDLEQMFTLLNQIYFQNAIPKPTLTWSSKNTYRILGHHDSTHNAITISKSLDDSRVPRFVVECVMYHEMLHIKHPTKYINGRRYSHTPAFRHDEREFAFFEESEAWIENHWAAFSKGKKQKRTGKKGFLQRLLDF